MKSAEDWVRRKLELQEHFDREIYGRVPESIPNVTWNLLQENEASVEGIPVWKHLYQGVVKPSFDTEIDVSLDLVLVLPKDSQTPVPIVLEYDWTPRFPNMPEGPKPSWKAQVLKRGLGYALLDPTSFQADHGAGLQEGIIGLMNHGKAQGLDQWGVLKAWAWGASRVMDLLETVPQVDADKVVIEGLSRYGKAALVAMAYDERFAIGFIGSSGAGGAKLLRRVLGEQVENLASSGAYHWFTPNFIKYAGPLTANDLPVDAHELIALCAPRPVFISVGSPEVEGQWIDARGMFIAAVHAEPVYELLGKEGLGTIEYPEISNGLLGGEIAFRQHEGGHTVYPNWPSFLNWAERYF